MLTAGLMTQTDFVLDAGRDTTMLMVVVSSLPQTLKDQPCKDARSGTGTPKPVLNAQTGGTSMLMASVLKSQLSAPLTMPTEHALDATVDSTLITESAKSLLVNPSLMPDATPGKMESAKLAQKTGSSTQTTSAESSTTNARLTTSATDGALPATKDTTSPRSWTPTTTSSMSPATSRLQIPLLPLISVAITGKTEPALPAQITGTLTPTMSANPSLTSARVMTLMDAV